MSTLPLLAPRRIVLLRTSLLLFLFLLLLSSPYCCVDATVNPPPLARLVFNASNLPPATIVIHPSVESLTIDTVNSTSAGATSNQTLRIEIWNWTSTASTTISISLISVTISDITVVSTSTVPPACAVSTPTTTRGLQLSVSRGRGFRLSLVGLVLCNSSSVSIDSVADVSVTVSSLAADGNSSVLLSRMQSTTLALVMPLTLSRSSSLTLVDSQSVSVSLEAALSGGNNALSLSGNSSMVVASSTLRSQLPAFSGVSGNVSRWQSSGNAALVAATLTSNSSLRIESNTCASAPCSVRLMLLSLSCSGSPLCVVMRSNTLDARGAASQAALFNLVYAAMTLEVATTMVASGGSSVSVTSNTLSSDYRAQYVSVGSSVTLSGGSSLLCSGNTVVGNMTTAVDGALSLQGVVVVLDVLFGGAVSLSGGSMVSTSGNIVNTAATVANATGWWAALLRVSVASGGLQGDASGSAFAVQSNVVSLGGPVGVLSSSSCTVVVSVTISSAVLTNGASVSVDGNQISSQGTARRCGLLLEHLGAVRVSSSSMASISTNVVRLPSLGVTSSAYATAIVVGWLFDSTLAVDSSGMLQMIGNSATVDTKSGASSIALGPTTMYGVAVVVSGMTSVTSGAVVSVSQNRVSMASGSSVSSGVIVSVSAAQTFVQSDGAVVVDNNTVLTPQGVRCGPFLSGGGSLDGFCGGVVLSHASLLLQSNGTVSLSSNTVSMVGSISASPSGGGCVTTLGTMLGGVVVMGTRNVADSGSFVASGGSTLFVQLNTVSLRGTDFNVLGIASFVWSTLSAQGGSSLIFEGNQVTCSMTTTLTNSNVIVGGVLVPTASTIQSLSESFTLVVRNTVTLTVINTTLSRRATVNGYAIGWHGQLSVGNTSSLSLSMNTVAISAVSIFSGSQVTVVGLSVRSTTTAAGGGGSLRIVDASQVSVDGNVLSCPSTAAGAGAVIGIWLELGSQNTCTVSAPASLAVVNSSILSFSFNTIRGTGALRNGGVLRATGGPSCTALAIWRSSRLIAQANVVSSPVTGSALHLEFVASFSSPLSAAVEAASGDSSSSSFMDAACVVVSRGSTISIRENVASAYVGLSGIEVYIQTTFTAAIGSNATSFVVSDQSQVSIDRNRIQSTGSHGVFLNLNFASSGGYSNAAVTGYVLNNRATLSLSSNVIGSSAGAGLRIFLSPASSCYDYVYDCPHCQDDVTACKSVGSNMSSCVLTSYWGWNKTAAAAWQFFCGWVSASCPATHCDFPATRVLHLLQSSLTVTSNDVTTAVSLRPAFLFDRSSGEMLSLTWSGGSSFRLSQNALRVTGGTTSSVFAMAVVDLFRCVVGVSGGSLCARSTDTQPHVGSVMGVEASVEFAGQSSMFVESNALVGYSVAWMWTTASTVIDNSTTFFFTSNTVLLAVGPPIVQGVPSSSLIGFFVNGVLGLSSTVSSSCPIRFRHNRFFTQGTSLRLIIFKVTLSSTVSSGVVSSFWCDSVNGAVASENRYTSWLSIGGVPTARPALFECTSRSLSREVTVTVLNSVSARVSSSRTSRTRVTTKTRSSSRSEFYRPHSPSRTLQAESTTVGIGASALQMPYSVSRALLSASRSELVTRASPLVTRTMSLSPSATSSTSLTIRSISLRRNATASAGMSGSLRTPTATTSATKGCPIRISELESVSPLWEAPPPLTISAAAADVTLSAPEVLVNGATLRARTAQSQALLAMLHEHYRKPAVSTELSISMWSGQIVLLRVTTSETLALATGNITAVADRESGFDTEVVVNVHRQREFTVVDGDILVAWINVSALLPQDDAWCAGSMMVPAFRLSVGAPLSSLQMAVRSTVTTSSTISMAFQLLTGDGGNELQSMILMGVMACTPRGSLQNGFGDLRALAPLLMEATFDSVIWSNLLLLGVVLMLQCVVMGVLAIARFVHIKSSSISDDEHASDDAAASGKLESNTSKRRGNSDRPDAVGASTTSVAQMARFPGVFISAVVFIYQGTLFAAIRLMQQNTNVEGGGALLAVGVVFTVVLYPLPLAVGLFANRIHRSYHTYLVKLGRTADVFTWQYRVFAALPALEATGVMLPRGMSERWGPLAAVVLPHSLWSTLPLAGGWLMCTASMLQFYHDRAYCTSIFVLLAFLDFVLCGVTLYNRPRRSTMINTLTAVQLAVCGVTLLVCAASAYDAKYGGGDTVMALLGFSQSGLSMGTTMATLFVVISDILQRRRACIVRLAWQVGELCTDARIEERRLRWYMAMRAKRRRVHRGAAAGVLLPLTDEEDVNDAEEFAPRCGEAEDDTEVGLSALLYLEDSLKDRHVGSFDADDVEMGPVMMNRSDASEAITALSFWTDSDGAGGNFGVTRQSLEEKMRTRTSLRDASVTDSGLAGRSTLALRPTQLLRGASGSDRHRPEARLSEGDEEEDVLSLSGSFVLPLLSDTGRGVRLTSVVSVEEQHQEHSKGQRRQQHHQRSRRRT